MLGFPRVRQREIRRPRRAVQIEQRARQAGGRVILRAVQQEGHALHARVLGGIAQGDCLTIPAPAADLFKIAIRRKKARKLGRVHVAAGQPPQRRVEDAALISCQPEQRFIALAGARRALDGQRMIGNERQFMLRRRHAGAGRVRCAERVRADLRRQRCRNRVCARKAAGCGLVRRNIQSRVARVGNHAARQNLRAQRNRNRRTRRGIRAVREHRRAFRESRAVHKRCRAPVIGCRAGRETRVRRCAFRGSRAGCKRRRATVVSCRVVGEIRVG